MKKIIAVLLAATAALSTALFLAGCGDEEYPVTVANCTIEKEPENVVVLDPAIADMMAYMSYERKFVGRSDSVNQPGMKSLASVGTDSNPDIDKIVSMNTEVVFANDSLSKGSQEKLELNNIKIIRMQQPESPTEVKTNYVTIGKVLGGKNAGAAIGSDTYDKLIGEFEKQKRSVEGLSGTGALKTICYLYTDNNSLTKLPNGCFGNTLMSYTNCVNVTEAGTETMVQPADIATANPNYIFYNDDATLKMIRSDANLSKINAVKGGQMMKLPLQNLSRPGATAVETLKSMIDFIYNGKTSTFDQTAETKANETQPASQSATQPASQPATQPASGAAQATTAPATTAPATTAPAAQDLSGQYKIDLEDLTLEKGEESDEVEIMQQRLFDLGFIKKEGDDTNITGYFGDYTENAVKAFQKKNGIEETGVADNATLKAMFMSTAKKA